MVMAADTLTEDSEILNKEIEKEGLEKPIIGRVVLGTVKRDVHNIGKEFAEQIRADGYGYDAQKAVELARELIRQ